MKQYRLDYIREWVEQWNECIPKTLEAIEMLPFDIFIWSTPFKDHYGDYIEDINEWQRQRHEYCVKLAEEYQIKNKD